jgi:negative regulator of sigma E activity
MMDEADEEALFARLRLRLESRPPADADLAARIEARVESAVASRTAELRAQLDRLAEHVGSLQRPVSGARRWAVPLLALAILAAVGIAAVVWAGRLGATPSPQPSPASGRGGVVPQARPATPPSPFGRGPG